MAEVDVYVALRGGFVGLIVCPQRYSLVDVSVPSPLVVVPDQVLDVLLVFSQTLKLKHPRLLQAVEIPNHLVPHHIRIFLLVHLHLLP